MESAEQLVAAISECTIACGWESGSPVEFGYHVNTLVPSGWSVITPPSIPTGYNMGSYCLKIDNAGGNGGNSALQLNGPLGRLAQGMGIMSYPLTNPTSGQFIVFGYRSQSGGGYAIIWNAADKKLYIVDLSTGATLAGPSTVALDAAAPKWYWLATRYNYAGGIGNIDIYVDIYEVTNGPTRTYKESLYANTFGAAPGDAEAIYLHVGPNYGLTHGVGGAIALDNLYGVAGGGYMPPIAPDFKAGTTAAYAVNAGTGTISTVGTAVTGSGTNFDPEITVVGNSGDYIKLTSGPQSGEIRRVTARASDTACTLASGFSANQGAGTTFSIIKCGGAYLNDTRWVTDAGVEDPENEWNRLDEVPPNDADYVKPSVTTSTLYQGYEATDGLVPGGSNILAVCVWFRYRAGPTWRTMFSVDGVTGILWGDAKTLKYLYWGADYDTWGYQIYVASWKMPDGTDWTIAGVNGLRPRHQRTAVDADSRVSQCIWYVVYGADHSPPPTLARQAQVI